ncbi:MAG: spermidine synthase [Alphaproteobacteria bacterium]
MKRLSRTTAPARLLALFLLILFAAPFGANNAAARDDRTVDPDTFEEKLILKKESVYNTIYVFEQAGLRYLKFGHNARQYIESIYNPADPTALPSAYTRYMTLGLAYARSLDRAVVVGMGGGRTAWYLAHHVPGMDVIGVELDPAIIEIADTLFDVRTGDNITVVERDGRIFFRQRRDETYDLIHVDAYRGPFVPFHLLTQEFYTLLKDRLRPGGAVVQNIEPSTMLFDHAIATIGSVFDTVDMYPASGNYVAIAYMGPRRSTGALLQRARERQRAHGLRYDLATLIGERTPRLPDYDPAKILTDDFAPANYLRSVKRYNRRWEEQKKDGAVHPSLEELLKR